MAELLALAPIAELQSMFVNQTFITPNIVLLQTKMCFKKMSNVHYHSFLEPKWNPNKNERYFKPSLNRIIITDIRLELIQHTVFLFCNKNTVKTTQVMLPFFSKAFKKITWYILCFNNIRML